jgi:hypothetical protein
MKRLILITLVAMSCVACEHGLPKQQQNESIQNIVKACHDNKGMSKTTYDPLDNVVYVNCWISYYNGTP